MVCSAAMNGSAPPPPAPGDIETLYQRLLQAWNRQDANGFAALLSESATVVGFDGSVMHGRQEVSTALQGIFQHHKTARYVWKIRSIRMLDTQVALLEAAAGMIPPNQTAIKPETNAIQHLLARLHHGQWRIELFQNTPAQFHGRPEAAAALTEELQHVAEGKEDF
jgi:uncharacterized protein (TIGR02246 family)